MYELNITSNLLASVCPKYSPRRETRSFHKIDVHVILAIRHMTTGCGVSSSLEAIHTERLELFNPCILVTAA